MNPILLFVLGFIAAIILVFLLNFVDSIFDTYGEIIIDTTTYDCETKSGDKYRLKQYVIKRIYQSGKIELRTESVKI